MRGKALWATLRTLALAVLFVFGGTATANAQDAGAAVAREQLRGMVDKTIAGAEQYQSTAQAPEARGIDNAALRAQLKKYGEFAEHLRGCLVNVREALRVSSEMAGPNSFTTEKTFKARFEEKKRGELVELDEETKETINKVSECRRDRLLLEDGEVACCSGINIEVQGAAGRAIAQELRFSGEFVGTWKGYSKNWGGLIIADTERVLERFDRKLIGGFPGMPWEYVLNIHGDIDGPSRHQIIWAHFNLGFEDGVQVAPGDNRIQPVLTIQGLGYNRYFLGSQKGFLRKVNYLGFAGIATVNGRRGVKTIRYGGVVHFGNYVSVGGTYGDHVWRVYASSNKVVDQILKIWN